MNLIHRMHSDIVSLARQNEKKLDLLSKVLYFVIALHLNMCLLRCLDSHTSAINTLTINESQLYGKDPICATAEVCILPGDLHCRSKSLFSFSLFLQPLYILAYLFHGIGWIISNYFGLFVWLLESVMSTFWCYPKESYLHEYIEENIEPARIFTIEGTSEHGMIESAIDWVHSHLYILMALLGLPWLAFLCLSFFFRTGPGGDTTLRINDDGSWEFAPSKKRAVVYHKYGSFNKQP